MNEGIAHCRQEGVMYFGVPSGSLLDHTVKLLIAAGLLKENPGRKYEVESELDGVTFRILDRIDIGRLIVMGVVDAGIAPKDYLHETAVNDQVEPIADFVYSKQTRQPSRLVVASKPRLITSIDDCRGAVIASELPNLTKAMLMQKFGFSAEETRNVFQSHGKTEGLVQFGVSKAFTDITETGKTLRENDLVELATLFESNPQLVANRDATENPAFVARIDQLATCFNAALLREVIPTTMLTMNVPRARLDEVLKLLPPTPDIIPTVDNQVVALTSQVPQQCVQTLMYQLLQCGADKIFDHVSQLTLSQDMRISCITTRHEDCDPA